MSGDLTILWTYCTPWQHVKKCRKCFTFCVLLANSERYRTPGEGSPLHWMPLFKSGVTSLHICMAHSVPYLQKSKKTAHVATTHFTDAESLKSLLLLIAMSGTLDTNMRPWTTKAASSPTASNLAANFGVTSIAVSWHFYILLHLLLLGSNDCGYINKAPALVIACWVTNSIGLNQIFESLSISPVAVQKFLIPWNSCLKACCDHCS